MDRRIEPAEQGFPFAVTIVVDIEKPGDVDFGGKNRFEPGFASGSISCRYLEDGRLGKFFFQSGMQSFQFFRLHQIEFVDDDELCLLQLFPVDIGHVFRKLSPVIQTENSSGPDRIHQYTERGHFIIVSVNFLHRETHGRDEVGATSHGFREKYFRPGFSRQISCGID